MASRTGWHIRLVGMVQGIGFRPFVYRIAVRHRLGGYVLNDSFGAEVYVEGPREALQAFWDDFWRELPPLAQVAKWDREEVKAHGVWEFEIRRSQRADGPTVAFVTPDAHVCEACLAEMGDPAERRYRYPFTNCTNCGPRYTIITAVPYDRPNTTMVDFPMCEDCRREYEDPMDRRFHAQPIACPRCGPEVWLVDAQGRRLAEGDAVREAARALRAGRIVAIKGLGGFHLAVDGTNEEAVRELRRRKWRESKPFALMVADLTTAEELVVLDEEARKVLESPARPILLAPKRPGARVAGAVAPGLAELGLMLPYTPLHYLLFEEAPQVLVMTSANVTAEPLVHENAEALERLRDIADLFLVHNRRIHNPCDDSVVRSRGPGVQMVRRARGYVPAPLLVEGLPQESGVLALGPELKNTVALSRPGQVVVSQHLGDLTNPRAIRAFEQAVDRLVELMDVRVRVVACDRHPQYRSTLYAKAYAASRGLPLVEVQHHHAHMAACMLENGLGIQDRVLGIVWDGTGYGLDGTTWGGEFLVGGYRDFRREAFVRPVPLPGGDAAVRHPWRLAEAFLMVAGWEGPAPGCVERQEPKHVALVRQMVEKGLRCPLSSGAGRLFDAAAAILDFNPRATDSIGYEAQLAVEFEALARDEPPTPDEDLLPYEFDGRVLDFLPALVRLRVLAGRRPAAELAARFSDTLAAGCAHAARLVCRRTSVDRVVLAGGCFQNLRLSREVSRRLREAGLQVLEHRHLPPNDGSVSVGQVAVALARKRP